MTLTKWLPRQVKVYPKKSRVHEFEMSYLLARRTIPETATFSRHVPYDRYILFDVVQDKT